MSSHEDLNGGDAHLIEYCITEEKLPKMSDVERQLAVSTREKYISIFYNEITERNNKQFYQVMV